MQNPIKKFRQSFIVFEKPVFLSENWKILTSSNYHRVQYFLVKLCTCFLLANLYKRKLFVKIEKDLVFSYTFVFYIFINNSRSKQTKKESRTPICRHCSVGNMSTISAKNIKLYGSWSSSRFSIFLHK